MAESADEGIPKATPLVLLWATTALFWSIFTPPVRTFAARVLLFQPLWLVRALTGDSTWVQDLALFLALHAVYGLGTGAWRMSTIHELSAWLDFSDAAMRVYLQVFALLGGCAALAGSIVYRGSRLESSDREGPIYEQRIDESLLDPLLIPSRTTHSRLFPEKHGFSYSYLLVGIPVGFQGRIGNVLSIDSPNPAWFDVKSTDYLNRGGVFNGLGEKLKRFLHSQGVTDRDYSFAYLVTAPRFLGYSFNPVSFWYIYDSDIRLKYMVLEVNNTFDERRMYLLRAADSSKSTPVSDPTPDGTTDADQSSKTLVFSDTFEKDFHVSPFNSRKGSYSLRAVDPLAAFQETGSVRIDNTIVLRSSKDSPKIVARIFSEGPPREPSGVTPPQLLRFIAAWWWVGLMTFPRILWEAQRLFLQKKLHVWFRPEVTETSVGRSYTADERVLEAHFRAFLAHAVERSRHPLRVIYEAAHHGDGNGNGDGDGDDSELVLYSPAFTYEEDKSRTLSLKVLSPAFYSRFAHYAHAREALDREGLATDDRNRTLVVGSAHVLPALFEAIADAGRDDAAAAADAPRYRYRGPGFLLDGLRWRLLRKLRCPPAAASFPSDSGRLDREFEIRDIRAFQFSELDRYVRSRREDADEYRRVVVKLFLAERLALGVPLLVVFGDFVWRSLLVLVAMAFCDRVRVFDVLRPRPFKRGDILPGGLAVLLANGVHIWSLFKG